MEHVAQYPTTMSTIPLSTHKWHEENGVIYFSVTSNGTTGEQWINRLENNGFLVEDGAKSALRSINFKLTSGITYEVAVLKGEIFEDNARSTSRVLEKADKHKLTRPNAEIGCLIREKFSDKELEAMGLRWIVAMHAPIMDSRGVPRLFAVSPHFASEFRVRPDGRGNWYRSDGFAFVVPSSKN